MAVCPHCDYRHYNKYQCPLCKEPVIYDCWSCGETIEPRREKHCKKCGWFVCPTCGECGCNEDRPPSNEERGYGWTNDDW